jgi:hypothetical protein
MNFILNHKYFLPCCHLYYGYLIEKKSKKINSLSINNNFTLIFNYNTLYYPRKINSIKTYYSGKFFKKIYYICG